MSAQDIFVYVLVAVLAVGYIAISIAIKKNNNNSSDKK